MKRVRSKYRMGNTGYLGTVEYHSAINVNDSLLHVTVGMSFTMLSKRQAGNSLAVFT